jgi:beta-glucosidase
MPVWNAEYFANTGMQGRPQVVRPEPGINYDWGGQSPVAGIPATNWSARWTGSFYFDAGDYTFFASSDDGVRVYIDGHIVIDEWQEQSPQKHQNTFRGIGAGQHTISVEYFQLGGGSSCKVMWQRA